MDSNAIVVTEASSLDDFLDIVVKRGIKSIKVASLKDPNSSPIITPQGEVVKIKIAFSAMMFNADKIPIEFVMYSETPESLEDNIHIKKSIDWLESYHGVVIGPGAYHPDMYDLKTIEKLASL